MKPPSPNFPIADEPLPPKAEQTPSGKHWSVGAAGLVGAKILALAFNIAVPLLLARKLDLQSLGIYRQVFLAATSVLGIVPLGFSMNVFYFFPRNPQLRGRIASNTVTHLSIVAGLVLAAFLAFPGIVPLITKDPATAAYAPWVGALGGLWIVAFFIDVAPIAAGETQFASTAIVLTNCTRAATIFTTAWVFGTIQAILIAAVLHACAQAAFVFYYLRSRFPDFPGNVDFRLWLEQISYMGRIVPPLMISVLLTELPPYFVSFRFNPAAYAVYASGWLNIPISQILLESAGSLLIPQIGMLESSGRRDEIIRLALAASRKLAIFLFPLSVLFAIVNHEFIVFLYTEKLAASAPIFIANVSVLPFAIFMSDPISRAFPQHQMAQLRVRLAIILTMFAGLWVGTTYFGLIGAAVVTAVTLCSERLIIGWFWFRKLGSRLSVLAPAFRQLGKIALATATAGVAGFFARSLVAHRLSPFWILAIVGVVFALVYISAFLLLDIPTDDEKDFVSTRVRRVLGWA